MQVRGLARALRLRDAFGAIEDVRRRGVPLGDEVPFGRVVNSPLAPGTPLTVVQPHEGCKVRVCSPALPLEKQLQSQSRPALYSSISIKLVQQSTAHFRCCTCACCFAACHRNNLQH